MIDRNHPGLSIVHQCELVGISRSSYYYEAKGENALNLELTLIRQKPRRLGRVFQRISGRDSGWGGFRRG